MLCTGQELSGLQWNDMERSSLEQSGLECICLERSEAWGDLAWSGRNLCGLISGQVWSVLESSGVSAMFRGCLDWSGVVWSVLEQSGLELPGMLWTGQLC